MTSSVRTLVTFQSNKFNTASPQEHYMNSGCFGDDLCKWMIGRLADAGIQCDSEPRQEDFGWYFNFEFDGPKYCFVCGFRPPDNNDAGAWIGWIERSTGFLSGLFGRRHKGIPLQVPQQIHEILSRSPDVSNIRWHLKRDFDRGNEVAGLSNPG